ncbi:PfkB family carbohydrate kinase [Streptomyces sp. LMG1-1-1.1]|uniref:PfkB family carbohydrate kinase n=1 Tax=Streptomyces sp. LMG1-1-1.1 TaxID=3135245 RepID=UPI0039C9A143
MIVTVTLNAALDVTWEVSDLRPRASHSVRAAHERAGGKGVNVARVLAFLGHSPLVTGLTGGPTGRLIHDGLRSAGIRTSFVTVAGESRRTVTVVSRNDGDATVFNGLGPAVTATEWQPP